MTMVAVRTSVEVLRFAPQSQRTQALFDALLSTASGAGFDVTDTPTYLGRSDLLVLWGAGSPLRWPAMTQQLARGAHVLAFDLAYWARYEKFRLSIDAPHPQAWVMRRNWPDARLLADGVQIAQAWQPDAPVLIAGIGDKAKVQYGADRVAQWEAQIAAECQAMGRVVWYRRKNGKGTAPAGVCCVDGGSIEEVLTGTSLLATWHSNAAIDAIRMGIPVVCQDGAAAAVCPQTLDRAQRPLPEACAWQFLSNLAYFQWAPSEAVDLWAFVRKVL